MHHFLSPFFLLKINTNTKIVDHVTIQIYLSIDTDIFSRGQASTLRESEMQKTKEQLSNAG